MHIKREKFGTRRLAVALAAAVSITMTASANLLDPAGDTFGFGPVQLDIAGTTATFTSSDLSFSMSFFGPIAPASNSLPISLFGFVEFDTDQNSATGTTPVQNTFGAPPSVLLGVEYVMDLGSVIFHPGSVDILNAVTNAPVGTVPITFGPSSFSTTVPLALLGGDSGLLNYGAIIGTFQEPTDEIPNTAAPGTSVVIPEAGTVLFGLACFALTGVSRRRR